MSKHSQAWFITLNTNLTNPKFAKPLQKCWNFILENMTTFSFGDRGAKILSVKEQSKNEIGPKDKKVHIHGFVEIVSMGVVSLNYSEIKKFVDNQLRRLPGFTGCHFDAQLVKNYNAVQQIKEYINKQEVEEPEKDDEFDNFEIQPKKN